MKILAATLLLFVFLGILVISLQDDDVGDSESPKNREKKPLVEKVLPSGKSDDSANVGTQEFGNNTEMGFLFSDPDLQKEVRDIIINDLKNVFSHLDVSISNEWVSFEGVGRKWPRALNSIGRVQERDGVYELVVSEEISEAYLKSLSLLTQEEIVLDAVWKEMLEVKKKMGEIPEKNYGDLIAELSFPLKLSDAPDDFLRGMMLSLGSDKFAFKSPSYLAFKKEIIGGKEYIVCEFIVMGMKEDEITHVEKNNFIQIDGKWKMIF